MNRKISVLIRNQITGYQPVFAPLHSEIGHGARQPPRNSVVATQDTTTMFTYSARKNSANFSDEYSVWNPPTSSDSASGRSNGARLVSPTIEITKLTKIGISIQESQPLVCASTMPAVDRVPEYRMTATIDRPMAIS